VGDWQQAYELLVEADAAGLLGAADLPLFAAVAYAAGHLDVTIEVWERAHAEGVRAELRGCGGSGGVRRRHRGGS
jgi:hypothetical protein